MNSVNDCIHLPDCHCTDMAEHERLKLAFNAVVEHAKWMEKEARKETLSRVKEAIGPTNGRRSGAADMGAQERAIGAINERKRILKELGLDEEVRS